MGVALCSGRDSGSYWVVVLRNAVEGLPGITQLVGGREGGSTQGKPFFA